MDNTNSKKINKNSPTMQYAIKLLKIMIDDIKSGECSEEQLIDTMAKINPENKGYIHPDDLLDYDKAGDLLHIGKNRNRLNNLCKTYNIDNVRLMGFRKTELLKLKQNLVSK